MIKLTFRGDMNTGGNGQSVTVHVPAIEYVTNYEDGSFIHLASGLGLYVQEAPHYVLTMMKMQ